MMSIGGFTQPEWPPCIYVRMSSPKGRLLPMNFSKGPVPTKMVSVSDENARTPWCVILLAPPLALVLSHWQKMEGVLQIPRCVAMPSFPPHKFRLNFESFIRFLLEYEKISLGRIGRPWMKLRAGHMWAQWPFCLPKFSHLFFIEEDGIWVKGVPSARRPELDWLWSCPAA